MKADVLDGYLGGFMPSSEVLGEIDENHNGLYSYEELAKAFGFSLGE